MVESSIKSILIGVLGKSADEFELHRDTAILGAIPEFDSMAVVAVLTAVEEEFGITIDDDEVDADVFETFGTLCGFVNGKLAG